MPVPLSSLKVEPWLKVLMMGGPKSGKTTAAVTTSPRPVRVILCEDDSALDQSRRMGADSYTDLELALGRAKIGNEGPYEQMTTFLAQAKEDAKAGRIKTLVWDPLTYWADRLLDQSFLVNKTSGDNDDGRLAYPHYAKRFHHCIELALTIPCHLIVVAHFEDLSGGGNTMGAARTGAGIVPNVPGKPRLSLGGRFRDVLWFDVDKDDPNRRVFYTHPSGVWGPGCRSMPAKYDILPGNFEELIKTFAKHRPSGKPMAAKPAVVNGAAKPAMKPPMKPMQQVKR